MDEYYFGLMRQCTGNLLGSAYGQQVYSTQLGFIQTPEYYNVKIDNNVDETLLLLEEEDL